MIGQAARGMSATIPASCEGDLNTCLLKGPGAVVVKRRRVHNVQRLDDASGPLPLAISASI